MDMAALLTAPIKGPSITVHRQSDGVVLIGPTTFELVRNCHRIIGSALLLLLDGTDFAAVVATAFVVWSVKAAVAHTIAASGAALELSWSAASGAWGSRPARMLREALALGSVTLAVLFLVEGTDFAAVITAALILWSARIAAGYLVAIPGVTLSLSWRTTRAVWGSKPIKSLRKKVVFEFMTLVLGPGGNAIVVTLFWPGWWVIGAGWFLVKLFG